MPANRSSASRRPKPTRPPVSRRSTQTTYHRRSVASGKGHSEFVPPETWYEPHGQNTTDYDIIVQPPGEGYEHVLSPKQIRNRLAQLPQEMLRPLEVIQLSGMTRKKKTSPCYGMQWGPALYLYPIESSRTELFGRPPNPSERVEATMYGAEWNFDDGVWQLVWNKKSLKDYYLNNILIHELGHLLDNRNRSYTDRERYAEWFAIEYGYKPSQRQRSERLGRRANSNVPRPVQRRHHKC